MIENRTCFSCPYSDCRVNKSEDDCSYLHPLDPTGEIKQERKQSEPTGITVRAADNWREYRKQYYELYRERLRAAQRRKRAMEKGG